MACPCEKVGGAAFQAEMQKVQVEDPDGVVGLEPGSSRWCIVSAGENPESFFTFSTNLTRSYLHIERYLFLSDPVIQSQKLGVLFLFGCNSF